MVPPMQAEIGMPAFTNSSLNYTQLKQIIEIKKKKIDNERKLEEFSKSIANFKDQQVYKAIQDRRVIKALMVILAQ